MTRGDERRGPPPLPGDCVPIPQIRTEVRDAQGHTAWVVETHVVAGLDLDGHGSPVVLVPPESQLNLNTMWWRLFIQRGDCGHELGIVIAVEDPVLAPGESHGLRNFSAIESVPSEVSAGQGIGATVYAFHGDRYVGGRTEFR